MLRAAGAKPAILPGISRSSKLHNQLPINRANIYLKLMMILGVSPLRGFPVERRGIDHLVPILGGRRLAGLVRLGEGCVHQQAAR